MGMAVSPDALTLRQLLTRRDNLYDPFIHQALTDSGLDERGIGWHDPTPADVGAGRRVAVVVPVRNAAYSLPSVLDALDAQRTAADVQITVIDDASTDNSAAIAADHPATDIVLRLPEKAGSGAARNVGTLLARPHVNQIVYLDADMVLPPHVLADLAARYHPRLVLVGFRHGVPYQPDPDGRPVLPGAEPSLTEDHRVLWRPPAGKRLFYTGLVLNDPLIGRPLDDTNEFRTLGYGHRYHDWDLPRMVVTALVAVPYEAVMQVGGFEPSFAAGWGCDDTYLGARLIAAGYKVAPVRPATGWHIDPPNAAAMWRAKFATAAANVTRYWTLLDQPLPARSLRNDPATGRLLAEGKRLK